MGNTEAMAAVEAVLFTMGESVEISQLAQLLEMTAEETKNILALMEERYADPACGLALRYYDDAVQLSTKSDQFENLVRIAGTPRRYNLTDAVLETLSIIAYKQPVTKAEIEDVRGVNCDFAVNRLMSYDLVCELGRKDAPGRPILLGTTEQFLRCFGVRSLEDLPSLNALQIEEFKEEAEKEVDTRLQI